MAEQLVLVDYGSGNLRSAERAAERMINEAGLNIKAHISAEPDVVARADRLILPGVGAYGDCARGIQAIDGMWQAIEAAVHSRAIPFLGICVGMQLMLTEGIEHGTHAGFNWLKGRVTPIREQGVAADMKVPHMGWNELHVSATGQSHPVLAELPDTHAYFVHSYAATDVPDANIMARATYGVPLTAAIAKDNMIGTQFHPEKSQKLGLALIRNFLEWKP